jgi:hypothetical protein
MRRASERESAARQARDIFFVCFCFFVFTLLVVWPESVPARLPLPVRVKLSSLQQCRAGAGAGAGAGGGAWYGGGGSADCEMFPLLQSTRFACWVCVSCRAGKVLEVVHIGLDVVAPVKAYKGAVADA